MRASQTISKLIRVGELVAFCLIFGRTTVKAQHVDWDMKGAQEVESPLLDLPARDQQGILHRLGGKPSELLAMRVNTATGHIFLVQGVYRIGGICGANNCEFWILSGDYRILLEKVIQAFKLRSSIHGGLPDVFTSREDGAFESGLSYWRFNGKRYVRIVCADAVYGDADGHTFDKPHISSYPCGTGG
jgi:hypothetical protein